MSETTTVRIPTEKRDILKVIAAIEKKDIKEILSNLIDEYVEQHKETLDFLSKPEWVTAIHDGKQEVSKKIKGKPIDELDD